ncbi:MAG TPA: S8 family serine peptidase, partial [Polyangia bacterium]|nr:S8 family serine peptidase [Polyangia bacterium]
MDRRFVRGELLVRFRSGIGQEARAGLLEQFDAEVKDGPPLPGVRLLEIDQATSVREVAAELEDQPGVRYAEPNYLYRIQATPNDPRFGELWGLDNTGQDLNGTSGTPGADIDAAEAWDATTGSSDITVAIVDTGIANGHPDLAPNIRTNPGESGGGKQSNGIDDDANGLIDDWRGWDFYQSDNDPSDLNGHGSHVAGTVGGSGDNGQGVAGVNWQVGLMPLRVCSARGGCPTSDIASAFAYAGAEGAEVVNASLGGRFSYTISDSIAGAPDTLFAAAAGNAGRDMDSPYTSSKSYPCAYGFPNIVCVAATTQSDGVAEFSNYGVRSVDLGAPGTNILSTWPAYKTVYSEDFEDDISSSWTTGGTHNSWGRTDEAAASGSFSLTDSPGAEYVGGTDSFAQTVAPIDLSEEAGCKLHYEVRLDLLGASPPNSSAELWIYGSSNGSSWNPIAGWIGSSGGDFVSLVDDLSLFDGQGTEFYLRFRLDSGFAVTGGGGAHVDDVEVRCRSSSYAGAEFEFLQGTSMATPHVAGAAALAWSLRPSASPSAVKGALLANADPTPSLATKTVSGARLNADIDRLAAPLITETDPDSPADENRPRVSGWIGPGEGLQVELFRNGTCAGTPAATGSAEQFLGAGIPIDVPDNVTTNLTARAAAGGGAEVCSSPFDYVEDSTFPPAFIHWTNAGAGGIGRASLDGSDPDQAFIPAYNPCGVSIDGRSVFWSASFLWSSRDGTSRLLELNRAELDGSVGAAIYGEWTAFEGADAPCGVAVDPSYVYWANSDGNAVGRAKLDGSSPEQSFISGASAPCGVTVDDSHVYWANGGSDTIGRANLDGSSPDQSFIGGAVDPCGVTVDDSHVYWANGGSDTIGRAKLDGSGAEQSFISGASAPCGVAVDRSYVYWANSGANTI